MRDTFLLGAVAYDAKVVPIWEGFRAWFEARGFDFDFVLFSNYERQVAAHLAGAVHAAWNSPLAWLQAERAARARGRKASAIAMRDTDQDLTSLIVVRADSPVRTLADLAGRRVAVGAADSPQATLIPLGHLRRAGLEPGRDVEVLRHERLVGKHGDHVGGERDAASALLCGEADAACLIEGNHLVFTREGTLPVASTRVLARTGAYDHCNFTVFDDAPAAATTRFRQLLLSMSYQDASVRPLLDMEGLKEWRPGRSSGYALLSEAVDAFGTLEPFLREIAAR
jgi:ABC-type phosphate/phosphonate transport system substrate-binding protein